MATVNSKVLPSRIKKYRLKAGLTQDDLAKLLNISRGCIANYEAGLRYPDIETVQKMAQLFNVSTEHLLGTYTTCVSLKEDDIDLLEKKMRIAENFGNSINLSEIDFLARIEIIDYFFFLKIRGLNL